MTQEVATSTELSPGECNGCSYAHSACQPGAFGCAPRRLNLLAAEAASVAVAVAVAVAASAERFVPQRETRDTIDARSDTDARTGWQAERALDHLELGLDQIFMPIAP